MANSTNKAAVHGGVENRFLPLLEIVFVFSPIFLLILVYKFLGVSNPMILIAATWVAYVVMMMLIAVTLKRSGESWGAIGLDFGPLDLKNVGRTILTSIGIFIFAMAAFVLGSIIMANIVGIPEGADLSKYNYLSGNLPMLLISLAGVYVVSSFGEEVVYRGFLISRLRSLFGYKTVTSSETDKGVVTSNETDAKTVDAQIENTDVSNPVPAESGATRRGPLLAALAVSSLIFGLAHFEWGAMGIVQTTFMGAAFGFALIYNNYRLWPVVLAHCYLDTILFVQLYLAPA